MILTVNMLINTYQTKLGRAQIFSSKKIFNSILTDCTYVNGKYALNEVIELNKNSKLSRLHKSLR